MANEDGEEQEAKKLEMKIARVQKYLKKRGWVSSEDQEKIDEGLAELDKLAAMAEKLKADGDKDMAKEAQKKIREMENSLRKLGWKPPEKVVEKPEK